MTEAELWQMMLLASEVTFSGLAGVSTVFFAYLAAAHFVGAKLTRVQAVLATLLFIAGAGCWSYFTFVFFRRAMYFMHQLGKNYRVDIFAPDAMLAIFPTILAMLIVGCVYFMYQVRKDSRSGGAPG